MTVSREEAYVPTLEDDVHALQELFAWLVRAAGVPASAVSEQADTVLAEAHAILDQEDHAAHCADVRRKASARIILIETLNRMTKLDQIAAAARADRPGSPVH